ncbi:hypothetical protein [Mesorhizobium sp. B1-1-7]|uniref:hypothetical protein n=1 Tax=Mesorhizobium sp. B1-1-7 TaxID=2589977 RepID=UPI0015E3FA3A|nr:hypothetical protein [Mesorhizobium sp. B1-1-7]
MISPTTSRLCAKAVSRCATPEPAPDLAKQILRGVHYVVIAQKCLADQAKLVSPQEGQ